MSIGAGGSAAGGGGAVVSIYFSVFKRRAHSHTLEITSLLVIFSFSLFLRFKSPQIYSQIHIESI